MNHRARPATTRAAATTSPPTSPAARCAGPASSSAVHRLPPRRPDVGFAEPRLRPRRPVQQPGRTASSGCRSRSLYIARQHRPRHPHLPRRVEHVPEPRAEQPPLQQLAALASPQAFAGHHRAGQRAASRSPCRRASSTFDQWQHDVVVAAQQHEEARVTGILRRRSTPCRRATRCSTPRSPADRSRTSGTTHKFEMKLVAPHNRRRFKIIVVGTGLAGGAAAATLGELGYDVHCFTFHDSPRRAHSIAAQGGINAAKNYKGDGDSIFRLFYDTVKGGDYRAREANVYRLAAGVGRHHRPVRRPGRAVRPRVRRPARQPQLRRRAGVAAPSTPGARPASSCCSAPTRRWPARSTPARSPCTRGRRCSTSS